MPFGKGVSGNPAGRPTLSEEDKAKREKIRKAYRVASKEALRILYEEVLKSPHSRIADKIVAARTILQYTYGSHAILEDYFAEPVDPDIQITVVTKKQRKEDDFNEQGTDD